MIRSIGVAVLLTGVAACGASTPTPKAAPTPVTRVAETASSAEIDTLWARAQRAIRHGKWDDAIKYLDRLLLEFPPGDARASQAHFFEGEAQFATGNHLQAVREFRKVSDDTPNDPLAAKALLRAGDAYADLWPRPELDPSYGQTALATYQELLNRYPGGPRPSAPRSASTTCRSDSRSRSTRPPCTTCGSRRTTRPSST